MMTRVARGRRPRPITGFAIGGSVLGGLLLIGALFSANATAIPSGFFTVVDQQGANDQPGQVDLTQMGRDDSTPGVSKIFWSWDSTDQWTGTGQTGDACALFDKNGNGNIDFVVCGQVDNQNANPTLVVQTTTSPYAFSCNDKRNDRCGNPSPVSYTWGTQIISGPIGNVSTSTRFGNLITNTDPFAAGANYPNDSTLEVDIQKSFLPPGALLVNVCSYPSAGNGGNNNPFDCITTPGGGFLKIVKDAGTDTTTTFPFTISPALASGGTSASVVGSGNTGALGIAITSSASVTENVPSNWVLSTAGCLKSDGTTATGTFSSTNKQVTGIAIDSGLVTTCTFVDRTVPQLTLAKSVTNDDGGTAVAKDFTLAATGSSGSFSGAAGTSATSLTGNTGAHTVTAGVTYTLSESGPSGYTAGSAWSCTGGTFTSPNQVSLALGANVTCSITNNDNAPSLTLIKNVKNDNGGSKVATDWTLSATGTGGFTDAVLSSISTVTGFDSSASTGAETVRAGVTYTLSESATPSGYSASSWSCTGGTFTSPNQVSLAVGTSATCSISNDDNKASPGIGTTMSWVLNDSVTLSGFRTGGAGGSATFNLYLNDNTCSLAGSLVDSETSAVDNSTGTASTPTGYATSTGGTYYWSVSYSGNNFNASNDGSTSCGQEVTSLP